MFFLVYPGNADTSGQKKVQCRWILPNSVANSQDSRNIRTHHRGVEQSG